MKTAAAAAKSLQSCPTLCDTMDCSLPGFSIHGILQVRTLEWVAISFSSAWKWKVKVKSLSRVWLLATLWTAAYQAPPSMGFSSQQYWSGVPLPSPKMKTSSLLKKKKRQSSDYLGTEMNAGGQVWGGRVDGLHGGLRKFQGMMEILCVLSVVLIS